MLTSVGELPPVSVAETLSLRPGIVDLWYYRCEDTGDAELLAAHNALMTPDERGRYERFHFDRDRLLFLATRALVRTVLSRYASVAPADWRFTADEHGKPHAASPNVEPPIFFNLANTPGLVVCAVSVAHRRVGVDAERSDRQGEYRQLADRFFAPSEARAVQAASGTEQRRRFLAFWTLKESYIKARGLGLKLPLDKFSFAIDDDAITIACDPCLNDDAAAWKFALLPLPQHHVVALGVDTGGVPLSLRAEGVVPLRG